MGILAAAITQIETDILPLQALPALGAADGAGLGFPVAAAFGVAVATVLGFACAAPAWRW